MWKKNVIGQFRKSVLLALFFNLVSLTASFSLYVLFNVEPFGVFFMLILIESALLMIFAGAIDFWNSVSMRKFMKRIDGKDWSREGHTKAQVRALYPLLTGLILILEVLISAIV